MQLVRTLAIDIGNTHAKAALFVNGELTEVFASNAFGRDEAVSLVEKSGRLSGCILSTVGHEPHEAEKVLEKHTRFIRLNAETPLPFRNGYATPGKLGMDRLAAAAGAMHFFPGRNCLVADAGTCLTFEFMDAAGTYHGGAISPGLRMRLKAMHSFTARLPEPTFAEPESFIGNDTDSCMLAGAFFGMLEEINGMAERYRERFGEVQLITCGGDAALFDKHIKSGIFAAPYLVLYGLNKILEFNVS